ncbi:MAG: GNAT family N-acetyltransferase [Saprospiraceae bacterium]|nr:GNAT family N-acetyltransferase [Saprospiraceae bacterium]
MFDTSININLQGSLVQLIPLTLKHNIHLYSILESFPDLMQYSPSVINSLKTAEDYISTALKERAAGRAYPFAVQHAVNGQIYGTTRFGNISSVHNRLEIGWTFLTPEVHGTGINTEMKFLMLTHAFESLKCNRVELKTDRRNLQSRKAILKLGAQEEGTLRSHTLMSDGHRRDTVYYSILQNEWSSIKEMLKQKLNI